MSKRILLLVGTNLLVVITISLILNLLGVNRLLQGSGANFTGLFIFCLVWGFAGAFISLGLSRIIAKMSMGVKIVDPRQPGQFSELVEMVHSLSQKAGLPAMPQVGVYESPEINAFATGPTRSRALVAVSTGLLRKMNRSEIEGVIGHEVAHVANGDMVTMTLLQGIINAFVMFLARVIAMFISSKRDGDEGVSFGGNWLLVMFLEAILSPLGFIVVAWFSRMREFRADAGGAAYAGKEKMVGALQALSRNMGRAGVEEDNRGGALATLKISGKPSRLLALLSTHPPLEVRIARLQAARD